MLLFWRRLCAVKGCISVCAHLKMSNWIGEKENRLGSRKTEKPFYGLQSRLDIREIKVV